MDRRGWLMRDDVNIDRLIPQKPPMRIVEGVRAIDDSNIESLACVRDTWPTVANGRAKTLMLVELVAQTAAVLQGWKERHEKSVGEGGLLVGIQGAKFASPSIPVGTNLVCTVRISHGVQTYLAFDGEVRDDKGTVWLTGSIQAFRPEPAPQPGETP
jgi:predicted hotdog family 3-hydroxylacyl-ACP dehydratase